MPPCVPIPTLPHPSLPSGISLAPPLPSLPAESLPNVCCLLPALASPKTPIPLPPLVVNPAFIVALREGLAAIEAYFDAIPLDCPRS